MAPTPLASFSQQRDCMPQPGHGQWLQGKGRFFDLLCKEPSGSSVSPIQVLDSCRQSLPPRSLKWNNFVITFLPSFSSTSRCVLFWFPALPHFRPSHSCDGLAAMSSACPFACCHRQDCCHLSARHSKRGAPEQQCRDRRGAPGCSAGSHRKREMIPCGFSGGHGALS